MYMWQVGKVVRIFFSKMLFFFFSLERGIIKNMQQMPPQQSVHFTASDFNHQILYL